MEEYERAQRSGELLQAVVCLECIDTAFVRLSERRPARIADTSMMDVFEVIS